MEKAGKIKKLMILGKLWENNGKRRIYFNDLVKLYGIEYTTHSTGTISHAELDGEVISNKSAGRYINDLQSGKFWFDLLTEKFEHKGLSDYFDDLVYEIEKRMDAFVVKNEYDRYVEIEFTKDMAIEFTKNVTYV